MAPKIAARRKSESSVDKPARNDVAQQTIKFEAAVQMWGFEPEPFFSKTLPTEFQSGALDERFKKQVIYTNERGEERVMDARITRWHGDGFVHVVFNVGNNDPAWRWEGSGESLEELIAPLAAHLKQWDIDKKPTQKTIERIQELTCTRAARIRDSREKRNRDK